MVEDDQFWPNGPAIDYLVFASEVHWEFCCEYEHVNKLLLPQIPVQVQSDRVSGD